MLALRYLDYGLWTPRKEAGQQVVTRELLASDWSLPGKAASGRGEDPREACPCPTAWPDTETFPPRGQTEILPNLSLHVVQLILYGQGQDGERQCQIQSP